MPYVRFEIHNRDLKLCNQPSPYLNEKHGMERSPFIRWVVHFVKLKVKMTVAPLLFIVHVPFIPKS